MLDETTRVLINVLCQTQDRVLRLWANSSWVVSVKQRVRERKPKIYEDLSSPPSPPLPPDTMPEMIYRFIEQNVHPGPHISLKCSARGFPPPQVSSTHILVSLFNEAVSHQKHLYSPTLFFCTITKVHLAAGLTTDSGCNITASLRHWPICRYVGRRH